MWDIQPAVARHPKRLRPLRERRVRRRRAPEVARQELLDAAERVFAEFSPAEVGLKDIGREAGVSHALITHYFGTFAGLVEAVLQRRLAALRDATVARIREAGVLSRPEELIAILFRTLEDPVHLRIMKWLISMDRLSAMHAFAFQEQGLRTIAHQVAAALQPQPTHKVIEAIELAIVCAVSAALGYAMNKHAIVGAIGKPVDAVLDEAVRKTLAAMLQAYVRDVISA